MSFTMEMLFVKHPMTMLVSGMTGSGKSYFVKKLIVHKRIMPFPSNVVWCYGEYQELFDTIPNVTFHEGLPSNINTFRDTLVIIDDLMSELSGDSRVSSLFCKGSHHRNLSVIFLVQNLFHKGKEMRDISLNCQYMVIFKNPRDKTQIMHLGKQLYPGKNKFFQEVFQDATAAPYSYILIDLKPNTEDSLRLRTGIFPGDKTVVYQPR